MSSDLAGMDYSNVSNISEIDTRANRLALSFGFQRHYKKFTVNSNLMATQLVANDLFSRDSQMWSRNLSVRTDVLELSTTIEVMPYKSWSIPVLKNLYFNAGLGLIYFEPKANYKGDWIRLQPLGTEGQNYLPGAHRYRRLALVIPAGLGLKCNLGDYSTVSLDFSIRKTFTDYLDDASTTYANPVLLTSQSGELAAILADRSPRPRAVGTQRANSETKDVYMTLGIKVSRNLGVKKAVDYRRFNARLKEVKVY